MSIVVENLVKLYGTQRAVDRISFEVKTGEVVGFLGPNGAGKSTTMKILACYIAPQEGEVRLGSHSIYGNEAEIHRKIGYLPENNPLYTDMYVIDYLGFCAALQDVPRAQIPTRIREMIHLCGLKREQYKKISELSKGYRQRVGIAQAMIHDPEVLILDEPTSGLDPNQIVEIRKLIKNLGQKKTVILSSHILSEVEATCERILIINKGRIVANGTPSSLQQEAMQGEKLKVQLSGDERDWKPKLLLLSEVAQVEVIDAAKNQYLVQSKPEQSSKKAIFALCAEEQQYLLGLEHTGSSLEDVFRTLTQ